MDRHLQSRCAMQQQGIFLAKLAQENGNTTLLVNMPSKPRAGKWKHHPSSQHDFYSDLWPSFPIPPPPDQVALEKRDSISYFPRKRKVNKIRIICETKMRGEKNKFRFINKTGERWIRSGHLWKMVWTVPLATMMNERYLAWFSVHSTNTYLNKAEKNIHAKVKIQNLSSPLIFRDSLDSPFFLGLNSYFIGHGNLWSFLLIWQPLTALLLTSQAMHLAASNGMVSVLDYLIAQAAVLSILFSFSFWFILTLIKTILYSIISLFDLDLIA